MSDTQAVWALFAGAFALFVFALAVIARRSSSLQKRLLPLVTSFGWEGAQAGWWNSVNGQWRGMAVRLQHMGRYKGVPERCS